MNGETPTWLTRLADRYRRHQTLVEWAYWPVVQFFTAIVAADSVVMEYARRGTPIMAWEPYSWELTSAASALLGIWLVIRFDRRFPLLSETIGRNLAAHVGFSIVFSLLHVVGMVAMREGIYAAMGRSYDFGNWPLELWYEYRKDAMTYAGVLLTLYVYRYLSSRLINEAAAIEEGEAPAPEGSRAERFLVRKFGKDFLLRADQVEWVEAAGNYMNLHAGGRAYPVRATMAALERELDPERFARVHRSFLVNLDHVESMTPQDSGDALVRMSDGAEVRLSRRYRDTFVARARGR